MQNLDPAARVAPQVEQVVCWGAAQPQLEQNFADGARVAPHCAHIDPGVAACSMGFPQRAQNFDCGLQGAWHDGHVVDCAVCGVAKLVACMVCCAIVPIDEPIPAPTMVPMPRPMPAPINVEDMPSFSAAACITLKPCSCW